MKTAKSRKRMWVLGVLLGLSLIGLGLILGQEMGVFRKGIHICMECIGIG